MRNVADNGQHTDSVLMVSPPERFTRGPIDAFRAAGRGQDGRDRGHLADPGPGQRPGQRDLDEAASGRNYPLGVTHGVVQAELLVTDHPLKFVYEPAADGAGEVPRKKVSWWLVPEVSALVLGSFTSARLSGKGRLLPRPPDETVVAFFGGILVGVGAAIAGGCVIGNIMSGYALMSVENILFGGVVLPANWTATYFSLMGGGIEIGKGR